MARLGQRATADSAGVSFDQIGVAIYAPGQKEILSVGVFNKEEHVKVLEKPAEAQEKQRLREQRWRVCGKPENPFGS